MNWADWLNDICILRVMDIHWSYQNLLFWASIVWHRLSANQIVRYFKLKKLYEVSSWFFASIEATKNIILFWVMLENTLDQSVCMIFYYWLVWLVNLNTGSPLLHCTCYICFRRTNFKPVLNLPAPCSRFSNTFAMFALKDTYHQQNWKSQTNLWQRIRSL